MATREFFFHHRLGYSKNPFGALTAEEWTAVAFIPPTVQQILDKGFTHLQLLGRKGCGKTTTLLKLAAMAQAQGQAVLYEYIPEGQSHFVSQPAAGGVFVLDEAQRLRWRERRRWLGWGTAVTFLFSSHTDLTLHFRRAHLPLATVWLDAEISLAHYHIWLERRLAYFGLPDAPRVTLDDTAIAYLYQTFGADMREAECFLYELFQHSWQPGEIGVEGMQWVRP